MRTKEANEIKMPIFRERFCSLRGSKTQAEFAEFIGISRPTVGFYENGERLPDALVLRKIAEKCGVSADWLLGLSDVKSTDQNKKNACEVTGLTEENVEFLHMAKIHHETLERALHLEIHAPDHDTLLDDFSYIALINTLLEILNGREHLMRKIKFALSSLYYLEKSRSQNPHERYEQDRQFYIGLQDKFDGIFDYLEKNHAFVVSGDEAKDTFRRNIRDGFSKFANCLINYESLFLKDSNDKKEYSAVHVLQRQIVLFEERIKSATPKGGEQNANDHTEERDI